MDKLKAKAIRLGASDFGYSKAKGKRFYVVYQNKRINFGSDIGSTFIDHGDDLKKKAWYARHSKITDKNGNLVINNVLSPSYWSAKLLW